MAERTIIPPPINTPQVAAPTYFAPVQRPETVAEVPGRDDGLVVIGRGTRVHGKIGDCRRLDVYGVLEADVVAEMLVIREGGGIKGTVQTDNAQIHGVFEGTLVVHDHLELQSTGNVTGEVSYRTLAIQAGARLRGNIVCSQAEAPDAIPADSAAKIIPLNSVTVNEPAPMAS